MEVSIDTEEKRVKCQLARARKLATEASLTTSQWRKTLVDFNNFCAYCQVRPFDVLEHFVPVSIAGTTVTNCIPACFKCNYKKSDRTGDSLVEAFGKAIIDRIKEYLLSRSSEQGVDEETVVTLSQTQRKPRWSTRKKQSSDLKLDNHQLTINEELNPHTRKQRDPEWYYGCSRIPYKEIYDIQDLFYHLSIFMKELSEISGINRATLTRIREGETVRSSTANKLINTFAKIYDRIILPEMVKGINTKPLD